MATSAAWHEDYARMSHRALNFSRAWGSSTFTEVDITAIEERAERRG